MRARSDRGWRGFTLAEMLVAAAVVAVITAVAMPSAGMLNGTSVDTAASEVVQALHFARQEAARLAEPTVVSFEENNIVRVFRLRDGVAPPVENPDSPVLHPGAKMPYRVALDGTAFMASGLRVSSRFAFADGTLSQQVAFGSAGNPVRVAGPAFSDVVALVASADQVVVSSGTSRRVISIDPVSGRVSSP
jgi:prepilin-type N-terminal cleavage/methylation domain-containing protein